MIVRIRTLFRASYIESALDTYSQKPFTGLVGARDGAEAGGAQTGGQNGFSQGFL